MKLVIEEIGANQVFTSLQTSYIHILIASIQWLISDKSATAGTGFQVNSTMSTATV